ncbi:MAG: phage holin family protein [bacterium]
MENYTEYFVPLVMAASLVSGYILKKWVKDLENKYIPTILAILGAVMNLGVSGVSIESAVYGAITGLASTGLHQAFTRFIETDSESGEE